MTGKDELIDALIAAFRDSGNQDDAIDNLAAKRLGVNRTDLLALNAIENAVAAGLTTGAVTGVSTASSARATPAASPIRRIAGASGSR